ncbi:hypothetical protein GCM10011510_07470 [Streptococcus himalayensis]|uniref:Uncharacterized protein n=1 Tax=Streptococcus himalayensis TaxID=1888195 RepID=A0A917A6H9_9STRE|nr:hypothetical protein GCM10011510_07470 [Streptococcus himalayensis]
MIDKTNLACVLKIADKTKGYAEDYSIILISNLPQSGGLLKQSDTHLISKIATTIYKNLFFAMKWAK